MGLINLYKGIGNEYEVIKGNGKIKDVAPELDFTKIILLNKGKAVNPDFELNDDTVILAREVPSSAATLAYLAVGLITSYFFYVAISGVSGLVYNKKISEAQEQAQRDAQNLAQQVNQYPFLKGAKNQKALGTTISYQLGRMYDTPVLINDGFINITDGDIVKPKTEYGKNQYYNAVLSLGNGNKRIEEILIGENSILKNAEGLASGKHFFNSDSPYYDAENFVEIRQAGEEFESEVFKTKVVYTQDGNEIKHDHDDAEGTPLIRQIGTYNKKLEVCIQFNGLREYVNSNWEERLATVRVYWTNKTNPAAEDWQEFYFNNMTDNTIKINTKNSVRFVATKEFTPNEVMEVVNGKVKHKEIMFKVVKTTPKAANNSNEDCYLLYYQATQYNPKGSNLIDGFVDCPMIDESLTNKLTRVAIRLKANSNTENLLDDIHVISTALAPTFNGANWSTTKQATRNPAAQIYEVLTSSTHKHSKYDVSDFDTTTLGALYTYCETNNLYCDYLVTSKVKKSDLLRNILGTCGANMFYNYEKGKLDFVIDKVESVPVALLNAEDIKSITYTKDFSRKVEGVKVTFVNSDSWQIETFYVMRDGKTRTNDSLLTELNLEYVTTYEQAYKLALKALKITVLQPREIKATVGKQGDYYPLYSTVLVQYKEFRIGLLSSTITKINKSGNYISSISISDEVDFEEGKNYGAIIEAVTDSGRKLLYAKVSQGETKKDLTITNVLITDIEPQLFNIVSIGELDSNNEFTKITNKMKIYGLEPDGANGFTLTLRDYNEAIYNAGTIPEYTPNITRVPKAANTIPDPDAKGLNGDNAFNSRTITLYIRSEATPQDLPFNFTQVFAHSDIDATTQQLNGWTLGLPAITEDNAPAWTIYQTQVSQGESADFLNTKWSNPVKVSQDVEVTKEEIQEMINDMKETGAPSVYASRTFASVLVDENGVATSAQEFETTVHVLQSGEDIDFSFKEIIVPQGWTVTHTKNVLKFIVAKGTTIDSGNISINIAYKPYLSYIVYGDESGDYYGDESGVAYGSKVLSENEVVYNLGFAYAELKGGRYLNTIYGAIDELSKIPSKLVLGDFFTWTGDDTETTLVSGGTFLKSAVYKWLGDVWQETSENKYLMPALDDIIGVANDELATNNSKAVQFFNKIVSNEVVASTLTVTGKAFMNKIIANVVSANTFISYVGNAKQEAENYADGVASDAIESANGYADEVAESAKSGAINETLEDLGFTDGDDVTIIQGGKIKTNKINVNEIFANDIKLKNIFYSEDFNQSCIKNGSYYSMFDDCKGSAIFNSKNSNGSMVCNNFYVCNINARGTDNTNLNNTEIKMTADRIIVDSFLSYAKTPLVAIYQLAPTSIDKTADYFYHFIIDNIMYVAGENWLNASGYICSVFDDEKQYPTFNIYKIKFMFESEYGSAVHRFNIYTTKGDFVEGVFHSTNSYTKIEKLNGSPIIYGVKEMRFIF